MIRLSSESVVYRMAMYQVLLYLNKIALYYRFPAIYNSNYSEFGEFKYLDDNSVKDNSNLHVPSLCNIIRIFDGVPVKLFKEFFNHPKCKNMSRGYYMFSYKERLDMMKTVIDNTRPAFTKQGYTYKGKSEYERLYSLVWMLDVMQHSSYKSKDINLYEDLFYKYNSLDKINDSYGGTITYRGLCYLNKCYADIFNRPAYYYFISLSKFEVILWKEYKKYYGESFGVWLSNDHQREFLLVSMICNILGWDLSNFLNLDKDPNNFIYRILDSTNFKN